MPTQRDPIPPPDSASHAEDPSLAERARASVGDAVDEARLQFTNLRQQARARVVLPPIILLVAMFIVAYIFRPQAPTVVDRTDYEYFFSASAAVLGTILIAIVLQANLFQGTSQRRMLIYGLLYIVIAEAAALFALLPGESDHLRGVLFALTASAGIEALLAVVYIAVRILESPPPELEIQADGSAVLGDSDAEQPRPGDADRRPVRSPAEEAERRERRERARAARRGRGAPDPTVVLHPDAVDDIEKLGRGERRVLLAITERILSNDRERRKRAVRVDEEFSELRAGSLRLVFRPLSAEEAAERGWEAGWLVRRILGAEDAQEWLRRAAAYGRDGGPGQRPSGSRGADR